MSGLSTRPSANQSQQPAHSEHELQLTERREVRGSGWSPPAFLLAVVAFLAAFAACMYQHFSGQQQCVTFFSDSRHYLETCRQLSDAMRVHLGGTPLSTATNAGSLTDCLMMDGPIMPLVPSLAFALMSRLPSSTDWQFFVVLGAIWHGLSAVFVAMLGARLMNKRWGFAAGLLWAFYPAAIIASGRFLTEPLATLLMVALLWLVEARSRIDSSAARTNATTATLGVCTGALLLLKPALVPACALLFGIVLCMTGSWKKRVQAVALLFCGTCLVLLPWVVYTRQATGHIYLTPQRTPQSNLGMGLDTDADGWGAKPESPLMAMISEDPNVGAELIGSWRDRPAKLLDLTLRKTARLWSISWNDFRCSALFVSARMQQWWHVLVVSGGLVGAIALSCRLALARTENQKRAMVTVGLGGIALIVAHLAYLPFETIARYGFSAMPFFVILAVYAAFACKGSTRALALLGCVLALGLIFSLSFGSAWFELCMSGCTNFREALQLSWMTQLVLLAAMLFLARGYATKISTSDNSARVARLIALSLVVLLGAVSTAFAIDGQHVRSWSSVLRRGQVACRQIDLSVTRSPASAWILIDGDKRVHHATLSLNDHEVQDLPEVIYRLRPSKYFSCNLMRTFASKLDMDVEDMRQWRAVAVPTSWLRLDGANVVRMRSSDGAPLTIFGDYDDAYSTRRHLPKLDSFSAGMLCNSLDGAEARLLDPVGSSVKSRSWQEGTAGIRGLESGQYRLCLLLGFDSPATENAKPVTQKLPETRVLPLLPSKFDPIFRNSSFPGQICISRSSLKAAAIVGYRIPVPSDLRTGESLRIRVQGDLSSLSKRSSVSVVPIITSAQNGNFSAALSATPSSLNAVQSWRHFDFSDELPANAMPGGIDSVSVCLYPGAWEETSEYGCIKRSGDSCLRNLTLTLQPVHRQLVDDKFLAIY